MLQSSTAVFAVADPDAIFITFLVSNWHYEIVEVILNLWLLKWCTFIYQKEKVELEIEARDKGEPVKSTQVTMDIEITQTINAYPQWVEDYSLVPTRVSENAPVNTIVRRLKATSSIPDSLVNYIIQPGETPEQNGQPRSFYYRIDEQTNEMILLTYKPLDYENLPQYMLTIKAAVRDSSPSILQWCHGLSDHDFVFIWVVRQMCMFTCLLLFGHLALVSLYSRKLCSLILLFVFAFWLGPFFKYV